MARNGAIASAPVAKNTICRKIQDLLGSFGIKKRRKHRDCLQSCVMLSGQIGPRARYWPFFKIAIFEHETWPLAKVLEVAHILCLYSRGSKLSLFSLYRQRFPRDWPFFC